MKRFASTLLVIAILFGLGNGAMPAVAQTANPADVIQAAYAAVAEKDIDTAMTHVADDMVLTLIPPPSGMDGVFIGKDAVREWWTELAEDNGRAEFSNVTVSGNMATWQAKWWGDSFEALGVGPAQFEQFRMDRLDCRFDVRDLA